MNRLLEIAIFVLIAALLMLVIEAHAACNCVAYSIEALKRMHVRLKTIPSVAVNDWCTHRHPGCYAGGVVWIRDIDDCRTMTHEFAHHGQRERYGDPVDMHDTWRREMQAAMITMHAESAMEPCR